MASKHEQCGPRKASYTGLTDHDTLKINVSGTKYTVGKYVCTLWAFSCLGNQLLSHYQPIKINYP